jgi:anti-anti-sigma factor
MALNVTQRFEEGFAILQLAGSLTLGPSLNALREAAKQVLANGKLNGLILQVEAITSVDSAGLGELTIVYGFANRQSLGIRLVGSTPSLLKMLDMTRLEELLPPSKDLSSAKQDLLKKNKI